MPTATEFDKNIVDSDDFQDRLWSHISDIDENDCYNCDLAQNSNGHCQIRVGKRLVFAHRISLYIATKKHPLNLLACHRCNNAKCINPDHLYWGTDSQNMIDRSMAGNHNKQKISAEQALEIRDYKGLTQKKLGEKFGISQRTVSDIKSGKIWKHLSTLG